MTCPDCGKEMRYDDFEDCWLCSNEDGCYRIVYPENVGIGKNPEAGIWKLGAE